MSKPKDSEMKRYWMYACMRFAGRSFIGRIFSRLACMMAPPHKGGIMLAGMNPRGFFAPTAEIFHDNLTFGSHVFIGDRVILFEGKGGGRITLGDNVRILRDSIIETGHDGAVSIGSDTWIHPRCQINAYKGKIKIGSDVQIAPNCAIYCHNHGITAGKNIIDQPLVVKGDVEIGDHSWLGVGVIVLSGVKIGNGAVIGAGSVVTKDIPDGAIAAGVPSRIIKMRNADS